MKITLIGTASKCCARGLTPGKEYVILKVFSGGKLDYNGMVMVINDNGMLSKVNGGDFWPMRMVREDD